MKKSKTAVRKSDLYGEIRSLIDAARNRVAVSVNAELTMLYWNVGHRINEEVLGKKRAAYGKQVVEELSKRLVGEFGAGWSYRQLMFCTQFAIYFPEIEIVNTLCSQLSWSHIKVLLGQNEEHVRLLELAKGNVRVASYLTELPPREVLEQKFRQAIEVAHCRMLAGK